MPMQAPVYSAPFVTIEGVDGAGKSSHVSTIVDLFRQAGFSVVETREPGGTALGETLRTLILEQPMALSSEVLLVFAARAEHLDQKIRPAIAAGSAVVCDRFTDSTFAYQGSAGGYPAEAIASLERVVLQGIKPDFTLLFDLPVAESMRRLSGTGKTPDKFESQPSAYFERVRSGYLQRVAADPGRFHVIDSSQPLEQVSQQVVAAVSGFLASRPSPRRQPRP